MSSYGNQVSAAQAGPVNSAALIGRTSEAEGLAYVLRANGSRLHPTAIASYTLFDKAANVTANVTANVAVPAAINVLDMQ